MKKIIKVVISTIILIFVVTLTNSVNANYQIVYQENANSYTRTNGDDFIRKMRNMELNGEVMGLYESLEDRNDDLTSNVSNNIDVHLQKNTEYGAMVLLSASTKYGKQPSENDTTTLKESRFVGYGTTTGNAYGVYMNDLDVHWGLYDEWDGWEIVAAAQGSGNTTYSQSINSRYVDRYETLNQSFNGDAFFNWHNTSSYAGRENNCGIARGDHSIFGYRQFWVYAYNNSNEKQTARTVVVCGEGI